VIDSDWRFRGKCAGRITEFEIDALGHGRNRDANARKLCAGCPVYMQCAQDAYDHPDHNGVVAAGRVIRGTKGGLTADEVRRDLAELLDVEFVPAKDAQAEITRRQTIPCAQCGHPTMGAVAYSQRRPEGVRPRHSKDTCQRCWNRMQRKAAA
jgi:hypothetical protein